MCVFSPSGVVEVYRVTRRVELGIKATAVCSEKLQQLLKDISRVWNNLMGFMSLANLAVRSSGQIYRKEHKFTFVADDAADEIFAVLEVPEYKIQIITGHFGRCTINSLPIT